MAAFFVSHRNLKIRKYTRLDNIVSFCNSITNTIGSGVKNARRIGGFFMEKGIKVLKLIGKAAASAIIWIAGRLERGK